MKRSTACLFLIGMFLWSVPVRASELRSDMECTRTVPADYFRMIVERDGRERDDPDQQHERDGGLGLAPPPEEDIAAGMEPGCGEGEREGRP